MSDKPSFDAEGTDLDAVPEAKPEGPRQKIEVHQGKDARGNVIHKSSTTLDEVREEHIYVFYRNSNYEMVLEVDLLGDQTVFKSDGKIPPVVHILCPRCVRNGFKDNALSITHSSMGGTKGFEIEDIPTKDWGAVPHPKGGYVMGSDGKPVIVRRKLTIKEVFKCEYCAARYKITDNEMRDS